MVLYQHAAACQRFEHDDSVIPAQMREGMFTEGIIDNIDHNLSSTTAHRFFHGTSLSLLQFPTINNPGQTRPPIRVPPENLKIPPLPDSYRIVPDVVCNINAVKIPEVIVPEILTNLKSAEDQELQWVQHGIRLLSKDPVQG